MKADGVRAEVNCMRCQHHAITHALGMRYQCNALGFKSAKLPCKVVLENSGLPCQYFLVRVERGR
jgi:hypothetical protein